MSDRAVTIRDLIERNTKPASRKGPDLLLHVVMVVTLTLPEYLRVLEAVTEHHDEGGDR